LPKSTSEGRTPKRVGLSFEDWIDHIGVDELALILDVTRATVLHWRAGRCDPRVDHMRRIKKMTRGVMGYEQMIDRHLIVIERKRKAARATGKVQ
jgi:hypothetical protein